MLHYEHVFRFVLFRFSYRAAVLELILNFAPLPNTPSYYFLYQQKNWHQTPMKKECNHNRDAATALLKTKWRYVYLELSFKINQQHSLSSQFSLSRGCSHSCAMVQVLGTKDDRASGTTTCQPQRLSTTRWAWSSLQKIRCLNILSEPLNCLASESSWY